MEHRIKNISRGVIKMKINWNRKYTTIAVYSLSVIIVSILFVVFVFKFDSFKQTFSWVGGIAAPLICGIAIAYILNPLMMYLENKIFGKFKTGQPKKKEIRKPENAVSGGKKVVRKLEKIAAPPEKRARARKVVARSVSLLLTFIIFLAIIVGIAVAIVPSVVNSVISLAQNMGGYIDKIEEWAKEVFENKPEVLNAILGEVNSINDIISKFADKLEPMGKNIWDNAVGFLGGFLSGLKNVLLGLIIAVYLLFSKERLMAQMKKVVCAFMKPARADGFLHICSKSNHIFKQYVISNIVDALIIMMFMLIGMFAMKMPYQVLIAAVCGVTNLVPFFGPFIGAIPCGILILLVDPTKVIWFGIFVLVLQQLDGNIIKPLLFGETMGLPAIWILVSITIGGAMFKIPGMLLGAPVFAVFYMLLADTVKKRLKKKNLPGETDIYEADSNILSEVYLQNAPPPGVVPVSFEEATKPVPEAEKELPEPISDRKSSRRKK